MQHSTDSLRVASAARVHGVTCRSKKNIVPMLAKHKIILLVFVVFSVSCGVFEILEEQVKSPTGKYTAKRYLSADESSIAPYGTWVVVQPTYLSWSKPASRKAIFAGFCEGSDEREMISWQSDNVLEIECEHNACDVIRREESWGDVSIQYNITFNKSDCAT